MHERGLAVDFTAGGALITSRTSPAFVWLKANAGSYGFYNLPSEPWPFSRASSRWRVRALEPGEPRKSGPVTE